TLSPRKRNDETISKKANDTGIATMAFVRPAEAARIHSAINPDVTTEATSQAASARSLGVTPSPTSTEISGLAESMLFSNRHESERASRLTEVCAARPGHLNVRHTPAPRVPQLRGQES